MSAACKELQARGRHREERLGGRKRKCWGARGVAFMVVSPSGGEKATRWRSDGGRAGRAPKEGGKGNPVLGKAAPLAQVARQETLREAAP